MSEISDIIFTQRMIQSQNRGENDPLNQQYGTFPTLRETTRGIRQEIENPWVPYWPYDLLNDLIPSFDSPTTSRDEEMGLIGMNGNDDDEVVPADAVEAINFILAMLVGLFSIMMFATLLMFIIVETKM